jgi:acyl carrier protein
MILSKEQIDDFMQYIGDKLGFHVSSINNKIDLEADLGADALDIIEIVMDSEKKYKIRIDDYELEKCNTVIDFIKLIEKSMSL